MPSTKGREPQDPSYINLEEEMEVQWWAVRFKVTPEQIHAAVKQFGPSPQEIEMQLSKAGKESFKNLGED